MPVRHHTPAAQRPYTDAGILPAEPDIAEVEQEQYAPAPQAVLVQHNGPISVRTLPARAGGAFGMQVGNAATNILGSDLKRARAILLATDQPFYYMTGEVSEPNTASAALWPINVPLELHNGSAVYVACATPASTSTMSVVTENFDGQ